MTNQRSTSRTIVSAVVTTMVLMTLLVLAPRTAEAHSGTCPHGHVCIYDGPDYSGAVFTVDLDQSSNHGRWLYFQAPTVGFNASSAVNASGHSIEIGRSLTVPAWSQRTFSGTSLDNYAYYMWVTAGSVPHPDTSTPTPTATPTPTPSPTPASSTNATIACTGGTESFESGTGAWRVGTGTRWNNSQYTASGNRSLRLTGKDGFQRTDFIESGGDQLTVTAHGYASSMEVNDAIVLESSTDGVSWSPAARWTRGSNLEPSSNSLTATISPTSSQPVALRFIMAASASTDRMYLDDITVTCGAGSNNPGAPSGPGEQSPTGGANPVCGVTESFEQGYGAWSTGNASLYNNSAWADDGRYSLLLRGTDQRRTTIELTNIGAAVAVSASALPYFMETGDALVLQSSPNGSDWTEVARWTRGSNLGAVRTSLDAVVNTGGTPLRLQFVMDTNQTSDYVFLDSIKITCGVTPTAGTNPPAGGGPEDDPRAGMPTAAVALGDSFVAGTGAGNYQPVRSVITNASGQATGWGPAQGFVGHVLDTELPGRQRFWCMRSANASIEVAPLTGIERRFNLACDGAQSQHIFGSGPREGLSSQAEQLALVARDNDVRLVMVGIGSNGSGWTFGSLLSECYFNYFQDMNFALRGADPCEPRRSQAQVDARSADILQAVDTVISTLESLTGDDGRRLYPAGSYRIVMQDYTNPFSPSAMPPERGGNFLFGDGANEARFDQAFRQGCSIHREGLASGQRLSQQLGEAVADAFSNIRARHPQQDVVYLNVQGAFDGRQLCHEVRPAWLLPGSGIRIPPTVLDPDAAYANPLRGIRVTNSNDPNGVVKLDDITGDGLIPTDIPLWDLLDLAAFEARLLELASERTGCPGYRVCNEAGHPNAAGHAALGRCLAQAQSATTRQQLQCGADGTTSIQLDAADEAISVSASARHRLRASDPLPSISYEVRILNPSGSLRDLRVRAIPSAGSVLGSDTSTTLTGRFVFTDLPLGTTNVQLIATAANGAVMMSDEITVAVIDRVAPGNGVSDPPAGGDPSETDPDENEPSTGACSSYITDFEANRGIWTGGSRVSVHEGPTMASSGTKSMKFNGSAGSLQATLQSVDVDTGDNDILVNFHAWGESLEGNESTVLEVSNNGGQTWTEAERWSGSSNTLRNGSQQLSASIPSNLTSATTRFQIRLDTTSFSDRIFVDNIVVRCDQ